MSSNGKGTTHGQPTPRASTEANRIEAALRARMETLRAAIAAKRAAGQYVSRAEIDAADQACSDYVEFDRDAGPGVTW